MKVGGLNNRFEPTIEEMFFIKNSREYAISTNHSHLYDKYKRYGYGNALSMYEDGKIRKNNIVNIYQSGMRKTYKITTQSGASISCTSNHRFPTPDGEKTVSQLFVGDLLYVKGEYQKRTDKHAFTDGNFKKNTPIKGQMGFQKIEDGAFVIYRNYRALKVKDECGCEICNKKINVNFELHHKDGDKTNNVVENYAWLCNSCHKKEHYKMKRTKMYEKGISTKTDAIISIEPLSEEMVYDIEMKDPAHNFISKSGLVTSNSHSYCMALDSLYGAYLKTHYPVEFYVSFLRMLEEGGKKDRMALTKIEAQGAFGIYFPPMKFRQDNREICGYPQKKQIINSLQSIKGFSKSIAENLYNIKDIKFDDFVDLLIYLEENEMMSTKIKDLISIQYFSEFGKNKKLSEIYELFRKSPNKYTMGLKDKTKEIRIANLKKIFSEIPNQNFSLTEQIKLDVELTGYIQSTYKVDKRYAYVQEVNTKYAPRTNLYCLANGKISSIKIKRNVFSKQKLNVGDVIYCEKFVLEPSKKLTDEGWVSDGTNTWWLDKYHITSPKIIE
jgi:hypothetical protein